MSRFTPFFTPARGTRRRVYVSGPMTGIEDSNAPAFYEAAVSLRKQGYAVCSPTETSEFLGKGLGHSQYLRFDFERLLEADFVVVLDGWETSLGALVEILMATRMRLGCYAWSEWSKGGARISADEVSGAIGRSTMLFRESPFLLVGGKY